MSSRALEPLPSPQRPRHSDTRSPSVVSSAASAIVAGAVLLVQDIYRQPAMTRPGGRRLSPLLMRGLLKSASSTAAVAGSRIGRMPDLGQLVGVLDGVPDLYLRDDVGDDRRGPEHGAISVSPDVAVSTTPMAPAAAFTPAEPTSSSDTTTSSTSA